MRSPAEWSSREFDVIVYGASGFTGRLVAEYLASSAPHGTSWALGGRSREKLESVRNEIAHFAPKAAEAPIVVADVSDERALRSMAKQARVVANTAGPFALHGTPVVAACVEEGTDYCDITGEVQWLRRIIDAFEERARATGARIVPTCGFDSIPSDLGTCMMHSFAHGLGDKLAEVKFFAGKSRGGFSGGTIASMMHIVDEAKRDPSLRRLLADPYALNPRLSPRGPDGADTMGVAFDEGLREWTGPFVMAAVNTRVVRRSNALLGFPYGEDFRYSERTACGGGPKGFARATALTAGLGAFFAAMTWPPSRSLIAKKLPAQGEGPSREARERGFFRVHLLTTLRSGRRLRGLVAGTKDPGYGETAKMLGESALCLARDEAPEVRGGLWTPASCMGMALVERLRSAGMTFTAEADA